MKIFILKLYGTPQKEENYCDVAGYFTNKKELLNALQKHYHELGIVNDYFIDEILFNCFGEISCSIFNSHAELANLEVEEVNKWTA